MLKGTGHTDSMECWAYRQSNNRDGLTKIKFSFAHMWMDQKTPKILEFRSVHHRFDTKCQMVKMKSFGFQKLFPPTLTPFWNKLVLHIQELEGRGGKQ